ncbi:hypothetical protein CTAYLR_007910 [Chrysophaeum taylorii]|uniref:Uncharacterized protein n=1 Tax=Chrysophaeum taylorii TaxID=2483200 RepID=A0AAD7U904_9STRA|nr:hypothetical protein CTAYLR_007910 [Chrysophaeum taylorii]
MGDVARVVTGEEAEVEEYLSQCRRLHIEPDASVLVTLSTQWDVLAPSFAFGEGKLLPLVGVLSSKRCHVTRLVLRAPSQTWTAWEGERASCDARVLARALARNTSVRELDLASCGLRDLGVAELAAAIEASPQIRRLDLRRNAFGDEGCRALRDALIRGKADGTCGLAELDVSWNGLGHRTVTQLAALREAMTLRIEDGNFTTEELLNALTHGVGCALALVGAVPLLEDAATRDRATYWMCVVYEATLVFCFASSCAYHACFQLPTAFKYLQRADHAAIYLLIAGSYAPFLGVGMRGHLGATAILVLVWIAGLTGSLCSAAGVGLSQRINPLEVTVYAMMGLAVLPVIASVHDAYPSEGFALLVLGGAAYLTGILFFVGATLHPFLHVVWHLFVLAGAFVHWFAIYLYVVPMVDHLLAKDDDVVAATDNVRNHLIDAQHNLASLLFTPLERASALKRASSLLAGLLADTNITMLPAHILPSLLATFAKADPPAQSIHDAADT